MSRTAYPTEQDLLNKLISSGVLDDSCDTDAPDYDYQLYIKSAIIEFERRTGYIPFLAETADSTAYFDPPGADRFKTNYAGYGWRGGGRILEIESGYTSVTSVTIGYSPTTVGTILTPNVQYFLRNANAALIGNPKTTIEFSWPQWGGGESIVIIGKRGFSTTVPEDAFQAIVNIGSIELLQMILTQRTGLSAKWQLGDMQETFERGAFNPLRDQMQSQVDRCINRYRRVVF